MLAHKKIQVGLLASTLVLASATTFAETQWCSGTVKNLIMGASGGLYVWTSWRNDYVRVCNTTQKIGSVTPQNCAAWFTMLQSAVTNKENMTFCYVNAPTCNTIPTYDLSPVPWSLMLID